MNEEIMIQEVAVGGNEVQVAAIGGAGCGVVCLGLGCADGGSFVPTGAGCGLGCDGAGCVGGGMGAGCAGGGGGAGCGGACAGAACGGLC